VILHALQTARLLARHNSGSGDQELMERALLLVERDPAMNYDAAPELLACLKMMEKYAPDEVEDLSDSFMCAVIASRAAIAKATGTTA